MSLFIVKVEHEGQTWYKHFGGNRINSKETAQKMSEGEAKQTIEWLKNQWINSTITLIPVTNNAK